MPERRIYYIDHLRIALTILVILHHTSITYGGSGGWYWREQQTDLSNPAHLALTMLCAIDQSYFMGFFFLLSGYFTPPAYDRKGPRAFLTDRLVRLGIPLLFYCFLIAPFTVALARTADGHPFDESFLNLIRHHYFGQGPLWFVQALLLFALVYLAWRRVRPQADGPRPFPRHFVLLLSALGVGTAAFLLRLIVPVGQEIFSFQIGYFASYVFLFIMGCLAYRGEWLDQVTLAKARPWFIASLATIPLLPLSLSLFGGNGFSGGLNPLALIYAFWEPFVAWGIILMLLWSFRTYLNRPFPGSAWLARHTYTVYIIHPPVVVGVTALLHAWAAPPLAKFAVAGTLASALCYLLAGILFAIPGARRVL